MSDQAQGLRRWAELRARQSQRPVPTLVVVGPPSVAVAAMATLRRWAGLGHPWVGDPARWQVLTVSAGAGNVAELAGQHPRWALWLGGGPDDYRRACLELRQLVAAGGPRRLLMLHGGVVARATVLENLRGAALRMLGVQLLMVAETPVSPALTATPG